MDGEIRNKKLKQGHESAFVWCKDKCSICSTSITPEPQVPWGQPSTSVFTIKLAVKTENHNGAMGD